MAFGFLQEYKLKCVMNNAMQIANQFKYLQSHYRKSAFFKDFHDLNEKNLLSLEYEIQTALKSGSLDRAVCVKQKEYISMDRKVKIIISKFFWHLD